jgi:excisionase family DNA binding protein
MTDLSTRKKLSTQEAADYLGLGKSTLDKLRVIRNDGPPFFKVGTRIVYDVADLDAWLAGHRRTSTSAPSIPAHVAA